MTILQQGLSTLRGKPMTDARIENHGSIMLLQPLTPAALEWIEDHVVAEPWQWWCGGLAVEPRYASDIVAGMQEDGLVVEG